MQELGASFEESDTIPSGMEDEVAQYREALVEAAVEMDDTAMEAYLEVRSPETDLMHSASLALQQSQQVIALKRGGSGEQAGTAGSGSRPKAVCFPCV